MNVTITKASLDDKAVIKRLLQLYLYDMAEYDNDSWADLNEHGVYPYKYLDSYWQDTSRIPLITRADEKLAGFVLVNEHVHLNQPPQTKSIAEFFVLRKYRRLGIGRQAVVSVFEQFAGDWEVAQDHRNHRAQEFWMRTIDSYTRGRFKREARHDEKWHGPIVSFNSKN
jgi:predicted acetyltransferase